MATMFTNSGTKRAERQRPTMKTPTALHREVFETSRELEYFTEKELRMQLGYQASWWPVTIVKELIDNALDACETAGVAPKITVKADGKGFSVSDNGPGIPPEIIGRSLDYMVRVSDKAYYLAPTRGQLGNALKAVYAAPFVTNGKSEVVIEAAGLRHRIVVDVDRLAQKPRVTHETEACLVRTGTKVRVAWPDSALLTWRAGRRFLQRRRGRRMGD